jgi:hypothetical protein
MGRASRRNPDRCRSRRRMTRASRLPVSWVCESSSARSIFRPEVEGTPTPREAVGVPDQRQAHAGDAERSEARPGTPGHRRLHRAVRQTGVAVPRRDLSGDVGAEGAVSVGDPYVVSGFSRTISFAAYVGPAKAGRHVPKETAGHRASQIRSRLVAAATHPRGRSNLNALNAERRQDAAHLGGHEPQVASNLVRRWLTCAAVS